MPYPFLHPNRSSKPTFKMLKASLQQDCTMRLTKKPQANRVQDHNVNSPKNWWNFKEGTVEENVYNPEHNSVDTLYKLSKTFKDLLGVETRRTTVRCILCQVQRFEPGRERAAES